MRPGPRDEPVHEPVHERRHGRSRAPSTVSCARYTRARRAGSCRPRTSRGCAGRTLEEQGDRPPAEGSMPCCCLAVFGLEGSGRVENSRTSATDRSATLRRSRPRAKPRPRPCSWHHSSGTRSGRMDIRPPSARRATSPKTPRTVIAPAPLLRDAGSGPTHRFQENASWLLPFRPDQHRPRTDPRDPVSHRAARPATDRRPRPHDAAAERRARAACRGPGLSLSGLLLARPCVRPLGVQPTGHE